MKRLQIFTRGLVKENAVLILMIGLCPALAVSGTVRDAFGMGLAATFVLFFSNVIIAIIRKRIPNEVRIPIFILIISTFVTIIDYFMQAFQPDLYRALGVFVPLIVVNCMILGRAEAFAQSNPPFISLWDGITSGLGYMMVLLIVAFIRELLGFGTLFGIRILPPNFINWTIMLTPPSAFFILGLLIWILKTLIKGDKS